MTNATYKSLVEQGKTHVENISQQYSPSDTSKIQELKAWNIDIAVHYSEMSFEEQQSIVGLSQITSSILENNKDIYYAIQSKLFDEHMRNKRKQKQE